MSQMIQTHEARSHYRKSQVQSVSGGGVSLVEGRESVVLSAPNRRKHQSTFGTHQSRQMFTEEVRTEDDAATYRPVPFLPPNCGILNHCARFLPTHSSLFLNCAQPVTLPYYYPAASLPISAYKRMCSVNTALSSCQRHLTRL